MHDPASFQVEHLHPPMYMHDDRAKDSTRSCCLRRAKAMKSALSLPCTLLTVYYGLRLTLHPRTPASQAGQPANK